MTQEKGSVGTYCRSALFVDFDNVYIQLEQEDRALADTFATQPGRWINWIEESLSANGTGGEMGRRRILVRRCYLNPRSFGKFRPYFIRNAFETVDCPKLTSLGKTSADVYMVLDALDLLSHQTFFDEFILLSADADFTPVLLKLRKHDRRTVVLAIGPSAAAYTAASDVLLHQDDFIAALGGVEEQHVEPETSPSKQRQRSPSKRIKELSQAVRNQMQENAKPVSLAALAHRLRTEFPDLGSDWGGHSSFNALLGHLDLGKLIRSHGGPGYLYDPDRHTPPSTEGTAADGSFAQSQPKVADVAKKVSELTDTPLLSSQQYADLFEFIAAEVNANGYRMASVSKAVRDECKKKDIPIARQQVNFILRGITFAGYQFGKEKGSAKDLAQAFCRNVSNLCARAQLELGGPEEKILSIWLTGNES